MKRIGAALVFVVVAVLFLSVVTPSHAGCKYYDSYGDAGGTITSVRVTSGGITTVYFSANYPMPLEEGVVSEISSYRATVPSALQQFVQNIFVTGNVNCEIEASNGCMSNIDKVLNAGTLMSLKCSPTVQFQ
jgi:hypothetical protein